jgi:hypothetical protein
MKKRFVGGVVGVALVMAAVIAGPASPASAHDVGKAVQAVYIKQVPSSPWYYCILGENHLWESSANQFTWAGGTHSRSGPFCANAQPAQSISIRLQLEKLVFGNWQLAGDSMGDWAPAGSSVVGSRWFTINVPSGSPGYYRVKSYHLVDFGAAVGVYSGILVSDSHWIG